MQLRMWSYDLAREQAPTYEHLRELADLTQKSGYNALGLYLEHRFAYPSAPWAAGIGAVLPDVIAKLVKEFPDLQIIPFVNLLGHCEGFLYSEEGAKFAEEHFAGLQACPSCPAFQEFAQGLLDDVLAAFPSQIIHIGGDETAQLGRCPKCAAMDKAQLYANHFGPLAKRVLDAGRRPAVWGDMFAEHPSALERLPKETLIYDWQYFNSPLKTASRFLDAGHEMVLCPALHTYNAPWLHLAQSDRNIQDHVTVAESLGVYGVCVTTWEMALFGSYETALPAIKAAGRILAEFPDSTPQSLNERKSSQVSFNLHGELANTADERQESLAPIVKFANAILTEAVIRQYVRFICDPQDQSLVVRAVAPNLEEAMRMPQNLEVPAINRLRLLCGMPVTGRLTHQTGFLEGTRSGVPFRYEVESIPCPGDRIKLVFQLVDEQPETKSYEHASGAPRLLAEYANESKAHEDWARLMGIDLPAIGGIFGYSQTRSALKCRFLLYSNPFLLWLRHREELCGDTGDRALVILEQAIAAAPNSGYRGVSEFVKIAIEFVRLTEISHLAYAAHKPGEAIAALAPARSSLETLATIAKAINLRIGGSLADIERCHTAKGHVERVMLRIKKYGDGSLGYLPSYETITHPKFVPFDQGNWWLINRWANE